MIFIDGDFDSKAGDCPFHCRPTCHPGQVGPVWVYGCRHKVWPQNRAHDFVPLVNCGGLKEKCEIRKRHIVAYRRGLMLRIKNADQKVEIWKKKVSEIDEFTRKFMRSMNTLISSYLTKNFWEITLENISFMNCGKQ